MKNEDAKTLAFAIHTAAVMHMNQFDKGGHPYVLHLMRVMDDVSKYGHRTMTVAVLHDIIEDTNMKPETLLEMNFDNDIVSSIYSLTKKNEVVEGYDYIQYIRTIKEDVMACRVKIADLIDNSDITRLKGLTDKDFKRMKKYQITLSYLTDKIQYDKFVDMIVQLK